MSGVLDRATEGLFETLSSARGRRIFHPQGIAFAGTVRADETVTGSTIFERGGEHEVVVRFSRGLGLPRGRPDFLGMAIHFEEAGQDLLLASSRRYVPRPVRSFAGTTLSSLLPFRVDGRLLLVGARIDDLGSGQEHDQLTELAAAAGDRTICAALAVARPGRTWTPVARLDVRERLSDDVSARLTFDPWRCGGGFVPAGWPNRLRVPAYRGSRRGRLSS